MSGRPDMEPPRRFPPPETVRVNPSEVFKPDGVIRSGFSPEYTEEIVPFKPEPVGAQTSEPTPDPKGSAPTDSQAQKQDGTFYEMFPNYDGPRRPDCWPIGGGENNRPEPKVPY